MALPNKHQLKFNIHKDAKSLMEAIENSSQEDINLKFLRSLPSEWKTHTLIWRNKADLAEQSLDDLLKNLKIYEAEVKGSSTSSHNTQNVAIVSSNNTDSTNNSQEDINLKFLRSLPSEWKTHTLIWRNKADLVEQSLDDLFKNLKIYEAEVKGSSTSSHNTQNVAIVSSNNTNNTNKSVNVVPNVSAASFQAPDSTLPNVDSLSDAVIYSIFTSQSNSSQLENEDLKQIDADYLEEMDLKWQIAMLTIRAMRRCHFTRNCRSPKDNRNKDTLRRTIPVEADEEPTNYALMAYASSDSSSSSGSDNETYSKNLSKLLECQIYDKTSLGYDSQVFNSQVFDCDELNSSWSDDSVPTSPLHDRYKLGEGYHVVPPPYTRTFMPPKPDLVFNDAPNASESMANVVPVKSHTYKPSKDLSKTLRPDAPIIEDWTSDSEEEFEIECGNPQHALKEKGVIDSGCSRHITGKISYLSDFEVFNGGYVAFGGNPKGGKISSKGKIKTGKLDFDDVYFVKELKFNLFSVPQMCEKNNSVIFTYTKCVVLSSDFKLPDENHVLLRVPRENNMYNVDLKNGKQHRASCKSKPVSSVSHPLQMLHMDLFRPTIVKSLNKKSYCLVVTDDYSRMKRTKREFSVARTPQQNGVTERKNMTLIKTARTMLVDSLVPIPFWAEEVNTACYVQNR
nr:ribonuclease H-like domain-containing protein [Tanacetum cinerariifolium]